MRLILSDELATAAKVLAADLHRATLHLTKIRLYGIPRGGVPASYLVAHHLCKTRDVEVVDLPDLADVLVDDLIDSGKTMMSYRARYPTRLFGSLFLKGPGTAVIPEKLYESTFWGKALIKDEWIVFPWEATQEGSAEDIVTRFLQFIGEDPQRGGLKETPARVIKAWRDEWFSGYKKNPGDVLKAFEDGAERYDEMIIVRDIPIYTHCEHHLAPFFGAADVAYIPRGRIVGLSKLVRLADIFARRLQVQERLTAQIADALVEPKGLDAKGAGVILRCRHLCMESRGIQKPGTTTVTSVMRGVMFNDPKARAEMLALLGRD